MKTTFAIELNWNTFTAEFGCFLNGYENKYDHDKVWNMFAPWIARFGYVPVRDLIVRYLNYIMEGSCYWSANYDLIGYKPAWYDAKYAMMHVLEILDEDFAE